MAIIAAVSLVCGCGGSADKARGYMNSGDSLLADLKPASEEFSKSVSAIFDGVFAGGKVEVKTFEREAADVKRQSEKLASGARKAKTEYGMILSLEGVGDYRKYAQAQLEIIDLNAEALDKLNGFLDEWSRAAAADAFDPVAFVNASMRFGETSDKLASRIEKLEKEAVELKKAKGL